LDVDMATDAAFLLVSFGGPEGPDDVMPFLRNVTAGRNVPSARLAAVARHYDLFGGVSPINEQCRELLAAIAADFATNGIDLPVYWGNRNWHPYLADTVRRMAADGIRAAIAFATSAYSSYSSCRQYLDDIERARAAVGENAPYVVKIPPYFREPGFTEALTAAASRAVASLPEAIRDAADLVFTAHSIPETMAAASGPAGGAYQAQLAEVAARVAARLGRDTWRLAYQSRSGPGTVPWLEPDIGDCLTALARSGSVGVVVVPIGFVSDHMEVIFDLDVEAARVARELRLPMARAATPGTDPSFVAMISSLVRDFASSGGSLPKSTPRHGDTLGSDIPSLCGPGCCARGGGQSASPAQAIR
jgi:protoporphyrin/coproporphyrin ferrochelatase